MKKIVAGIVAHVDAGKTTLSEAMMYAAGKLKTAGRVDKGDAFLDPDALEKRRGITIYSHQANLQYHDLDLTMIDTPGHVDFAAQTEQALSVLDYAILVVSASHGIQAHTRTLWRLLDHYEVPTFIFINKADAQGADVDAVLAQIQREFSDGVVNFSTDLAADEYETMAMEADDTVIDQLMQTGKLSDDCVRDLIRDRHVFPCYVGSALKMDRVTDLLDGLSRWTAESKFGAEFGAQVFKISHADDGERLTWVRVTGGELKNKTELVPGEKANQLRIYDGAKFTLAQTVVAGGVCAITGLTQSRSGQGLGSEPDNFEAEIQPVLNYALNANGNDVHKCLAAIRQLEDEDPQLQVTWSNQVEEIHLQIMGDMQLEVLQQVLLDRFDLAVTFDEGQILYRETINQPVEGVGHFEPLRHYAEVHVILEPGDPGSGLTFESQCSQDLLGSNWQHQVRTNVFSKQHLGVLIGAPLTDVKVVLVSGRSHIKHSEGGDFREATWRSIRQGQMMLKAHDGNVLLEPWYRFRMEIESEQVGRAMHDVQEMHGTFAEPSVGDKTQTVLTGFAPVATMRDYARTFQSYTHGKGQFDVTFDGYRTCHNEADVITAADYDPVADLENTPDSVFCAHGAGYPVKWSDVPLAAHVPYQK